MHTDPTGGGGVSSRGGRNVKTRLKSILDVARLMGPVKVLIAALCLLALIPVTALIPANTWALAALRARRRARQRRRARA